MHMRFLSSTMLAALVMSAPLAVKAEETVLDAPAIWSMKDDDSTIYLFGTFHALPPELEWQTDAYNDAMEDAKITVVEADVASAEAKASMTKMVLEEGRNSPGVTLSSILGEERTERFQAVASKHGVPIEILEPLRPWLAGMTVSIFAMKKVGFDSESGVEAILLEQAKTEGDSVQYLETGASQISILAGLEDTEILQNFDASLDQIEDFQAILADTVDAWKVGDLEVLSALINRQLKDSSPEVVEKLLIQRNRNWVVKLKEMMDADENYFVAVGAGHLVGEDSVIDLLLEEGYEIERIQ